MFIGHWAAAFAAAAAHKRAPKLGTLFIAAQLVDWGFFIFASAGLEKMRVVPGITAMNPLDLYYMPYTHSLLGSAVWALAFLAVLVIAGRHLVTALIAAAVVLSHWFVDLLVHRPDLTLAGGDTYLGLGLWNYPPLAMALELILVLATFAWYISRTKGPMLPPWILLGFLFLLQAINWFGPEPTEANIAFYVSALVSYAAAAAIAFWVGTTRRHIDNRGLAASTTWR